jgi:hypothetical protein
MSSLRWIDHSGLVAGSRNVAQLSTWRVKSLGTRARLVVAVRILMVVCGTSPVFAGPMG